MGRTKTRILTGTAQSVDGTYHMINKRPSRRINTNLSIALIDAVDAEAKARGLTRTELIEQSLLSTLHGMGWRLE